MRRREALMVMGAALLVKPATAADGGVLVFGGTGALGAEVVKALLAKGEKVTVFARPTSDKKRLAGLDVDYIVGDLTKPGDVARALSGKTYRVIVETSANRDQPPPFYEKAMINVVGGAKVAGVKQIILHGSVGAGNSEAIFVGPKATFPTPDWEKRKPNMNDKLGAETAVINSGITYTIIRNGLIDPEGSAHTGKAKLTEDEMAFTRVTRADLARLTIECLDTPKCGNKLFHAVDDSLTGPRPRGGR